MIALCGIPLEARGTWTDEESAVFSLFEGPASGASFELATADVPLTDLPLSGHSTTLHWNDLVLSMRNPNLTARIDFASRSCALQRSDRDATSLKILLRTLLTCELPRRGMLPIHGGGAIIDGRAAVFIGRSGAGKSTLAASCPHPLLSDELVAINAARGTVSETGFWGDAVVRPVTHHAEFDVAALLALEKAPANALHRRPSTEAARAMVASLLVPAGPVWHHVLPLIEQIALPYYHLAWNKDTSPWPAIARALNDAGRVRDRR